MDYTVMIHLTISLSFTLDVHVLWHQLADSSRLSSKLGRGRRGSLKLGRRRGCCEVKTALVWEH